MLCNILLKPIIPSGVCEVKHMYWFLQDMDCNLPLGVLELCSHMENTVERSFTPQTHWGGFSVFQ